MLTNVPELDERPEFYIFWDYLEWDDWSLLEVLSISDSVYLSFVALSDHPVRVEWVCQFDRSMLKETRTERRSKVRHKLGLVQMNHWTSGRWPSLPRVVVEWRERTEEAKTFAKFLISIVLYPNANSKCRVHVVKWINTKSERDRVSNKNGKRGKSKGNNPLNLDLSHLYSVNERIRGLWIHNSLHQHSFNDTDEEGQLTKSEHVSRPMKEKSDSKNQFSSHSRRSIRANIHINLSPMFFRPLLTISRQSLR